MTCTTATVSNSEGRLMSGYGVRAGRRTGEPTMHAGIDIGIPAGGIVYAPRAGVVSSVANDSDPRARGFNGYGNAVVIHHTDEDVYTFYAHLSRALVVEGQNVLPGTPIGVVGNTSNGKFPGMGRHLHMEVRRPRADGSSPYPGGYNRFNIDPQLWLAGHGVTFTRDITADRAQEACMSPLRASSSSPLPDGGMPLYGLRGVGKLYPDGWGGVGKGRSALGALDELDNATDPNHAYEPVVPDNAFYQPLSALAVASVPALLIGVGVVGVALTLSSYQRR